MFDSLFDDKQGKEIAYRRMHQINSLVRDIEAFTETRYNRRLKEVICELPQELQNGNIVSNS